MIRVHLFIDGESWKTVEMSTAPVVGDVIRDLEDCEFLVVVSRQWDISPTAKPQLHIHTEPATPA